MIDCISGSATVQIGTENADRTEFLEINRHKTFEVLRDGYTHLLLINEQEYLFVDLLASEGIPSNDAIKIMENISFL